MNEFDVSVRIRADGQGLVSEVRGADREIKKLAGAGAQNAAAARADAAATNTQAQSKQQLAAAAALAERAMRQQRNAGVQLGFQIQDVTQQLALGVPVMRIFAQQGTQVAFALTGFGGAIGRVASFLSGPFGSLLLGGTLIIGALAESFFRARREAEAKTTALKNLAEAQDALNKLSKNGEQQQRDEAARTRDETRQLLDKAIEDRDKLLKQLEAARKNIEIGGVIGSLGKSDAAQLVEDIRAIQKTIDDTQASLRGLDAKKAFDKIAEEFDAALKASREFERELSRIQDLFAAGLIGEAERDSLARAATVARDEAQKAAQEAARALQTQKRQADELDRLTRALEGFAAGADPAAKRALELARALEQIDKAAKAGADAGLVERARAAVNEALAPETAQGFLAAQQAAAKQQIDLIKLSNREREIAIELESRLADAKRRGVALSEQDVAQLRQIVAAEVDAARAADHRADAARRAAQESARQAEQNFRDLSNNFFDLFNDKGFSFWRSFKATGLRALAEMAAAQVLGVTPPNGAGLTGGGGLFNALTRSLGFGGGGAAAAAPAGVPAGDPLANILVKRAGAPNQTSLAQQAQTFFKPVTDGLKSTFKPLFDGLSKNLGGLFQGAQLGSFVAGAADFLGLGGSQTGGAVGGALGQIAGGPIGSLIGSVAGTIIGGLFKSTPKGSATISSGQFGLGVSSSFGNQGREAQAVGLAEGVIGAIDQIAAQLGADVASSLNLGSIGSRKKNFVFDPSGQGLVKGAGVQTFGSEAEAQAAAIRNALAKGAVEGLSDAVQRALKSSTDLDKALATALKVQDLEDLLRGVTDPFIKGFEDFERVAADRLKTARQFGFDLIELEKVNARDRQALLDRQLEATTGPVKRLLDELRLGSLAEGSLVDRRQALLDEQARLRAAADGGDVTVFDRLAQISAQLLEVSQEAFGSTGTFAGDREGTIGLLDRLLAETEARIRDAQAQAQAPDPQLAEANASLDDIALANQRMLAELQRLNGGIAGLGSIPGLVFDPRISAQVFR